MRRSLDSGLTLDTTLVSTHYYAEDEDILLKQINHMEKLIFDVV